MKNFIVDPSSDDLPYPYNVCVNVYRANTRGAIEPQPIYGSDKLGYIINYLTIRNCIVLLKNQESRCSSDPLKKCRFMFL